MMAMTTILASLSRTVLNQMMESASSNSAFPSTAVHYSQSHILFSSSHFPNSQGPRSAIRHEELY